MCCDVTVQSCVWVRRWNTFHLFFFLLWPTFSSMSALPASQGWAQQGQRLALTRIKPMRKFEFIGPYLLATCGALWANGRIGSLLPFSKACFLANRHLSNMTIGHRRDSWRGLINYLFIWGNNMNNLLVSMWEGSSNFRFFLFVSISNPLASIHHNAAPLN